MPVTKTIAPQLSGYEAEFYTGVTNVSDEIIINRAIAELPTTGSILKLQPGIYNLKAPIIAQSNMILDFRLATINLVTGSNCNMLMNSGANIQRTLSDANITNGQNILTSNSAKFTSADVGQTVSIYQGLANSQYLTTTISSITNAKTVVLATNAGATVTNGTCYIYYRDKNITILGGIWNRGNNGTGAAYGNASFLLTHIDGLYIDSPQASCSSNGYLMLLGDLTNYTIKNLQLTSTTGNGDGLHIQGPALRGYVENVEGQTADDLVAINNYDSGVFLPFAGDIIGLEVKGIFSNNCASAFKAYGGKSCKIRGVTVRGIYGTTYGSNNAINVWDDDNAPCDIDITIEDIDVVSAISSVVNLQPSVGGRIVLRNLTYRGTTNDLISVTTHSGEGSTVNIKNLVVDGIHLETGSDMYMVNVFNGSIDSLSVSNVKLKSGATGRIIVQSGVTVTNIFVDKVQGFYTGNASTPVVDDEGTVKVVHMDNIYLNGGGRLLVTGTGVAEMQLLANNITLDGAYELGYIRSVVDMSLSNLNVLSLNQANLCELIGVGANIKVRGKGFFNPTNVGTFFRDGSQTPQLVHSEMQADIATLAKNNGDQAYNTNASHGDVGVNISNGTNWKNIYTGTIF